MRIARQLASALASARPATYHSRLAAMATTAAAPRAYPPARRDDAAGDTLHGTRVPDPYRWLEDPDSAETRAWVDAQVATTGAYFDGVRGTRDRIRARLEQLQSYERVGCPFTRGSAAFVFRNTGLQNQDVLYKLPAGAVAGAGVGPGAAPLFDASVATPFLDLNAQFPDGTTSLGSSALSEDGRYYAYGLSKGGSDWQTLHVRNVATGADLPGDVVPWTKFTRIAWAHDGSGFWYSRHPAPPEVVAAAGEGAAAAKAGTETSSTQYAMVMWHELGTPASEDLLVYALPSQPVWRFGAEVSDDGDYLLITTYKGTDPVNRLFYAHLPSVWAPWKAAVRAARAAAAGTGADATPAYLRPGATPPAPEDYAYLPVVRPVDAFTAEFEYVTNDGPRFYLKTNADAPRYRVVAVDFPPAHGAHTVAGSDVPADVDRPLPRLADVVPHHGKDVLDWATVVGGRYLLTCYLRDVANALTLRVLPAAPPALDSGATALSSASEVPLPGPGTIVSFSGRRDQDAAYVKFVSFLSPGTILRLSFNTAANADPAAHPEALSAVLPPAPASALHAAGGAGGFIAGVPHPYGGGGGPADPSPVRAADVSTLYTTTLPGFDASAFESARVFVPSKDGTVQLPVFVVRKKAAGGGAAQPAPTLLYGYGGFNVSLQPSFSALRLLWLGELGGTYALACVRGGGEYGEEWHAAGQRLRKQNVFDDFCGVAEWLRSPASGAAVAAALSGGAASAPAAAVPVASALGIMGGSNGGLLTLACALQRPRLFDAVVSQVPVTDMVRFHRFTVGALWRGEYGYVEDDPADLACVLAYSPLHNVKPPGSPAEALPATLITTADHDDRVSPLHSYKMAAQLQAVAGASPHQVAPLLVRIETQAGHGAGKPTSKVLDEYADVWAFLADHTGARFAAAE